MSEYLELHRKMKKQHEDFVAARAARQRQETGIPERIEGEWVVVWYPDQCECNQPHGGYIDCPVHGRVW